jgi:hypothetical protein
LPSTLKHFTCLGNKNIKLKINLENSHFTNAIFIDETIKIKGKKDNEIHGEHKISSLDMGYINPDEHLHKHYDVGHLIYYGNKTNPFIDVGFI